MQQNINEIEINGVKYVPKSSVQEPVKTGPLSIVRCESAGVFLAEVQNYQPANGTAELRNSRRLWYWSGAASLSQLAVDGTSKPKDCKFPVAVPGMTVAKVIEIIPVTEKAAESLTKVAVWNA
jgi:hypothetical protein